MFIHEEACGMRIGITIIGNIILILGIIGFFVAAMAGMAHQNEINRYEEDAGVLARSLDPDLEEQYQEHLAEKEKADGNQGLGLIMSIVGLIILVAGYCLPAKKKKDEENKDEK